MNKETQPTNGPGTAFETAQAQYGQAEVGAFLPPLDDPLYRPVLVELIRADLEYSWKRLQPKQLEDYQPLFDGLANVREILEGVAFEEYRLRRQAGERPSPADFEKRVGQMLGPANPR
jgi:hypothetical protein